MSLGRGLLLALPQLVVGNGKCILAPGQDEFFLESCARNHDDPFMCCGFDCRDHPDGACSHFCCYEPAAAAMDAPQQIDTEVSCSHVDNWRFPGSDINVFVDVASADLCQGHCSSEPRCKSWTYHKNDLVSKTGKCFIKSSSSVISDGFASDCCVSGHRCDAQIDAPGTSMPLLIGASALVLICLCMCCMMCKCQGDTSQPAAKPAQGGTKSVSSLSSSSSSSASAHPQPSSPPPKTVGEAPGASLSMTVAVAVPAPPSPPPTDPVAVVVPAVPSPPPTEPEACGRVCPHCGAQVFDLEGAFCGSCGQPLR